jgi:hypothetical protein
MTGRIARCLKRREFQILVAVIYPLEKSIIFFTFMEGKNEKNGVLLFGFGHVFGNGNSCSKFGKGKFRKLSGKL